MEDDESPPMVLEEDSRAYRIVNRTVKRKLVEMFPDFGIDDPDNVLCEYIQVLLCNRKQKSQVIADLTPFLEDGSKKFTNWLWDYLRFLADSYQEKPKLSSNRSKSVARDIELIHDKRKREGEPEEEYTSHRQPSVRRGHSSARRSQARSSHRCGHHERKHHRSSSKAPDRSTRDRSRSVESIEGPKKTMHSRRANEQEMHANGQSAVAVQPYPVAYQQPVQVLQYVPTQPNQPVLQGRQTVMVGPDGAVIATATPVPAAVVPIQGTGAVRNVYQPTTVVKPTWNTPPELLETGTVHPRSHSRRPPPDDYLAADEDIPHRSPRISDHSSGRTQPNRRPTWMAEDAEVEEEEPEDDSKPPVRFVVTFRGIPDHAADDSPQRHEHYSTPHHHGIPDGGHHHVVNGRHRSDLVMDNFGHGTSRGHPMEYGQAAGMPILNGAAAQGIGGRPAVTVTFGGPGVGMAVPPAPIHYSASGAPLAIPAPQPAVYTGPGSLLLNPNCNPLANPAPLITESFIPSNNTVSLVSMANGPRNIITTFRERPPEVPAFKRLRAGSSSLIIDFNDDDDDGVEQDWASQNVNLMNNGHIAQTSGTMQWPVMKNRAGPPLSWP